METKIIGLILLICAALIFQYSYDDVVENYFSPAVKLKKTIEKDITKSLDAQAPRSKGDIHHVKFSFRSTEAQEFLKKPPPNFQTNKNGNVWLEVEVLDLSDEENPGFITQTSVFDLRTKNKIAEFGETYYIKDFDSGAKVIIKSSPAKSKETSKVDQNQVSEKQLSENSKDKDSKSEGTNKPKTTNNEADESKKEEIKKVVK